MHNYTNSSNAGVHVFSIDNSAETVNKEADYSQWVCKAIREDGKRGILGGCVSLLIMVILGGFCLISAILWIDDIKEDTISLAGLIFMVCGSILFAFMSGFYLKTKIKEYKYPLEIDPLKTALTSGVKCSDIYNAMTKPELSIMGMRVGEKCVVQSENILNVFSLEDITLIYFGVVGKSQISFLLSTKQGFKHEVKWDRNEIGSLKEAATRFTLLTHKMAAYCPNAKVITETK